MVKLEKKIKLLRDAKKNSLTEETIKNLAEHIRKELVLDERYEDCIKITTLEAKLLKSFETNKMKLVRKVGLTKKQLKDLMEL